MLNKAMLHGPESLQFVLQLPCMPRILLPKPKNHVLGMQDFLSMIPIQGSRTFVWVVLKIMGPFQLHVVLRQL